MARIGYPIIIGIVGFGLVLRFALFDYMLVKDAGREFILYTSITETGVWSVIPSQGLLSSCLFTTYFPAIFQRTFDTDLVMTFKLFPCFIIPALPIVVYFLAKKWVSPSYAFLAACFLMGQVHFLGAPAYARIAIASVFFGLALLVIFNSDIGFRTKVWLFVLLSLGLVTAHYSVTFVTLFVIGIAVIAMFSLKIVKGYHYSNLWAGVAFLAILSLATVVWLGIINTTPLRYGLVMIEKTIELETSPPCYPSGEYIEEATGGIGESEKDYGFFSLESRSVLLQVAFGKTLSVMNIPQKIKWGLSWFFVMLMAWGLVLIVKRWGLREEWVLLMLACYSAIAFSVIIPAIGWGYGVGQVHFQALVALAPCFVFGGLDVARRLRIPATLLLLVFLILYLVCMLGIADNIFGVLLAL